VSLQVLVSSAVTVQVELVPPGFGETELQFERNNIRVFDSLNMIGHHVVSDMG
jgi:hypothetical protein